ncbi:MAG: bifunctional 4-hydroxy-2-oxoglutarate aldolase/2-dehydro-3-deoxy-phosphogluconate aldolase [Oscillospiraceae bacterium]|nr:bifunctional 4-hydroxy-2-oxoglutarate aldolase/2-dehydro-3-deoxy-phosphogluconate aldolase [Oscillospiraceae bacterium]
MNITEKLAASGVVPVVVIKNAADAVPTAKAMVAGGVCCMEITMRTPAALDCIRAVTAECPDMLVGAGTVITLEQCKQAVAAGAKFIVAPGFCREVVAWCVENNISVTPGCVTPTEIMMALEFGIKVIKFFPSNVYGGLKAMKALSGPFGDVKFLPTGGVSGENMAEYLKEPYIFAVGGSWICTKDDISAGNLDKITALCRAASDIVKAVRG